MGEHETNADKIKLLVDSANTDENNCSYVSVPVGVPLYDVLITSSIFTGVGGGGGGGAAATGGQFAQYGGVNPALDPELAMVRAVVDTGGAVAHLLVCMVHVHSSPPPPPRVRRMFDLCVVVLHVDRLLLLLLSEITCRQLPRRWSKCAAPRKPRMTPPSNLQPVATIPRLTLALLRLPHLHL